MEVAKRINGTTLQAIRRAQFEADPLCARCKAQGLIVMAAESDHIIALINGGAESIENRQLLCLECHKIKSAEDLGRRRRLPKRRVGVDGFPIDDDSARTMPRGD